jgi:hypothetical protein
VLETAMPRGDIRKRPSAHLSSKGSPIKFGADYPFAILSGCEFFETFSNTFFFQPKKKFELKIFEIIFKGERMFLKKI